MTITKDSVRSFLQNAYKHMPSSFLNNLAEEIFVKFSKFTIPIMLPRQSDSLAITMSKPKTTALVYDRILFSPHLWINCDDNIYFHCGTKSEMANIMVFFALTVIDMKIGAHRKNTFGEMAATDTYERALRILYKDVYAAKNLSPAIIYNSRAACDAEFTPGPQQVLTAAITNIALVDEDSLTWEQVQEFRKDTEARAKYKRLVRWIDEELKTKSPAVVQDLIAIRLDDYEWSIKKHGMKTKLGALSCVLDPKFLGAASMAVGASALAGGPFWAALASASLPIGRALVSFGQSYIDSLDERRKENYEVAYIHDIKKKTT